MNYSFLRASYQPALIVTAGTLVFFGFAGVGEIVMRALRLVLPSPWRMVCAVLLGIQSVMLCVELPAMAGAAPRSVLLVFGWGLLAVGAGQAASLARGLRFRFTGAADRTVLAIVLVAAISLATALLVATAPSTKFDEIYYHMLALARIANDGALIFYLKPWQTAIWPQMAFQISLTPLHALRVPDAGNVVGWWLAATLAAFAWRTIRDNGGDALWSAVWTAAFCTGLYPIVWHVTAGSHSMGDLALCAGGAAWMLRHRLFAQIGATRFALLVGVLTVAAASSKVSLLPISLLLLAVTIIWLFRRDEGQRIRLVVAAAAMPWFVFYAPIVFWTFRASGSPFGPLLSDAFPRSVYGHGVARQMFDSARDINAESVPALALDALIGYSPLIWIGVAGAFLSRAVAVRDRLAMAGLLVAHLIVISVFAYPSVRLIGGLQYGIAISFAAIAAKSWPDWPIARNRFAFATLLLALLVPWLIVQVYYAAPFIPVATGVQTRKKFSERYVAFYQDFEALDSVLPGNAVIFSPDFRIGAVYSPRPMYFDTSDLPSGRPAYALLDASQSPDSTLRTVDGFVREERVYRNESATVKTYRTPGRAPLIGALEVVRLAGARSR
ncbi:MAG TPA: hypothetical protein VGQ30_10795 [Gemmatimonadaceae bacterium]|nr:hypothetical protein [Gemmatimonadaceae bacterium]